MVYLASKYREGIANRIEWENIQKAVIAKDKTQANCIGVNIFAVEFTLKVE